ncbi:MAG: lysine 2,3-aminomutase [Planctomycetes bacterium]|nr:lysine 2,3-aminomutase [Planctomycetota bacterium]
MDDDFTPRAFRAYQRGQLDRIPGIDRLDPEHRDAIRAVAAVLPFRVNGYVVEELIDWDRVPEDPIFQLTFPQRDMLDPADYRTMLRLVRSRAPRAELQRVAQAIRARLNPQPAGQLELNVPRLFGRPLRGLQHKYRETVLFFPANGQTCHTYCTYCFRWAQFVGGPELRFVDRESVDLVHYLRMHPEISDVLVTGGDPLVMTTPVLRRYVEPLLDARLDSVRTIRIGSKALAWWPYRFTHGEDADDLLRLFEEIVASGRHVALMAHYSHPRELSTAVAERAIARVRGTGAVVRCQAPLVRHVNDNPFVWATLWQRQVELGAVPYYMFVERDTGARRYFEVPLARALEIFQGAYRRVSGLARSVRGPSMSALPGKVLLDGVAQVGGQRVFVLKFLQGRDPEWANQVFFAKFDPRAVWLDDLEPASGRDEFFFEEGLRRLRQARSSLGGARATGGAPWPSTDAS